MSLKIGWLVEFHVSRQTRDYYRFDDILFAYNGNVVFANFHAARQFAQKMNDRKNLAFFPEQAVKAGQINAMGLIDEILHVLFEQYRKERNPNVIQIALDWLNVEIGESLVDSTLRQFASDFPTTALYRQELTLDDYLKGSSIHPDGQTVPNRHIILEEMLMLWLANQNPAYAPHLELFDDEALKKKTAYVPMINSLNSFFESQPGFGPNQQNLIALLRSPALAAPYSLTDQLEFIRTRWVSILGATLFRIFSNRLLVSLDLVKEEEKPVFGVGGGGPVEIYEFTGHEIEPERFSQDLDWMPRLVLIAKNSFVWLDQLSKKYQLPITRLDQIPDGELDDLKRWGITGLWLIGLWERSKASKTIKQLRGNPEAVASAYSLMNYSIAEELGGEPAYQSLRERTWQRGIRLASDMVPNHMGVDSRWVIEHPDWFISLNYPPFPSYSFNGTNLSSDDRVGIFIEDHYFDNSDAAVVFKRVDFWSGDEKFIYHGNDGTSMPWNDTAQLNYLLPEVREAVIQTILQVARKFPIIRFDAAMTLAKRHYQRLWFPEPGKGGDIPSRAEFGLTKEQFETAFPEEFWRDVVDRVAAEAPDTLLLAEAFWLMEGYFVRTLGMHRVYNSAFMNMLRDEKNQEYRLVIKNTLEFEPEILKRYVNFMNNPDERTTVDQFGKGDKYFGTLTMMITMPGLPMLGHGQIEGFSEKYGMEYRRAYWDEQVDETLVQRHEREIFPLARMRYLFAEVRDFLLYDFYTPEGYVNEDVYAYSNRTGEERALILYHNKYADTRGWIRTSTPYPLKDASDEQRVFIHKSLGEGLGLRDQAGIFTIFRDQNRSLEFIRSSQELYYQGLYVELSGYEYHVFLDFREVQDDESRSYAQLAEYLAGRGVPDIEEALRELFLQPLYVPYRELVNPGWYRWIIENLPLLDEKQTSTKPLPEAKTISPVERNIDMATVQKAILEDVEVRTSNLYLEIQRMTGSDGDLDAAVQRTRNDLHAIFSLPGLPKMLNIPKSGKLTQAINYLLGGPQPKTELAQEEPQAWPVLLSWAFNRSLSIAGVSDNSPEQSRTWMDEWLLAKINLQTLRELGLEDSTARRQVDLVKLLVGHQDWFQPQKNGELSAFTVLQSWLKDSSFQRWINTNRYQGILWFNQEKFEEWLWWAFVISMVSELSIRSSAGELSGLAKAIRDNYTLISQLRAAERKSDFQIEKLLQAAGD